MPYSNFLNTITKKVNALFDDISANYNFDNGPEFEIALCKLLRSVLPQKYGICRGFVVTQGGDKRGDDIIIYDQERFITLRLLDDNTYAQKQEIPIEAVYAYIEAKNTICLEGSGGQSLNKALAQISAVKELERNAIPLTQITPNVSIQNYNAGRPEYWPQIWNPIFCAIISRNVRINDNGSICNTDDVISYFNSSCNKISKEKNPPDMLIVNSDLLALSAVGSQIESPFFVNGHSLLTGFRSENIAFAIGIINLLYAFEYIMLGTIHWPYILAEGLKLDLTNV